MCVTGGDDENLISEQESPFPDSRGRKKVHKTTGVRTNYQKNENGERKVAYKDDNDEDDEHTGGVNVHEVSLNSDQGWFHRVGVRGNPSNQEESAVSREIVPIVPRRRF